jgi:hypothetical protein
MSPRATLLRSLLLLTVTLVTAAGLLWIAHPRTTADTAAPIAPDAVTAAPTAGAVDAREPAAVPPATPAALEPVATAAPPSAAPSAAPSAPASAGMRAYLDPETGVIGPMPRSAAEAAELDAVGGELPDPIEIRRPDGTVLLDLQGHMQEYYVVQLDANGKRVVRCVSDPKLALEAPPAPAPQPEER